jgi:DNA polymerase-3 subunit epsilon
MRVISFDTETTAIPDWKNPSDGPDQPHLMSVAAILFDDETHDVLDTLDVLVRPDGWVCTQEAFEVHGITHERALAEGIPEPEALERFHQLELRAAVRTAFNTTFDNRMIRIAQKRYWPQDEHHAERMRIWKEEKSLYFCTMINTKKHLLLPKNPTLEAAHQLLFNKPLREPGQPHTAMQDARAAMEIFLELRRRGVTV